MRHEPEIAGCCLSPPDCREKSPFLDLVCAPCARRAPGSLGGRRAKPARLCVLLLEREKPRRWESGKPAFGFPLFHPPSSPALGKCGNLACCWRDSQGARGNSGKPVFGFPRFPQPRHFHSALLSLCFPALRQQRQLRFLHPPRGFGVAPGGGLPLQHSGGDSFFQVFLPTLYRRELLVGRSIILVTVGPLALAT